MKDFKNTLKKLDEASQEKELKVEDKKETTPKEKNNPTIKVESNLNIDDILKTFENEEINSTATFTYKGTKAFNNYLKALACVKHIKMKDILKQALNDYIKNNSTKEEQKQALQYKKDYLD